MKNNRQKRIALITLLMAVILSKLDFYIVDPALIPIHEGVNTSSRGLQIVAPFFIHAFLFHISLMMVAVLLIITFL
ncbi:MAG: hypothetical protein LBF27_04845 [Sphingobacterium sp.]|jgi:NADH:ubiquinone oxidoreductase subunit E|nr:hypothetical protein [Sphingobacterium sp.]